MWTLPGWPPNPMPSGNTMLHTGDVLRVLAVCPQARGWGHGQPWRSRVLGAGSWAVSEGREYTLTPHSGLWVS